MTLLSAPAMSFTADFKRPIADNQQDYGRQELPDNPSAIALFSYAVCCIAQGAVLLLYFGGVVFLPIALSQGLF